MTTESAAQRESAEWQDHPYDTAMAAAESIRTLNHLTMHRDDFTVSDVYELAGHLTTLTQRLPQLARQLGAIVEYRRSIGELRQDDGTEPDIAVASAINALMVAAERSSEGAIAFDVAQQRLSATIDVASIELD